MHDTYDLVIKAGKVTKEKSPIVIRMCQQTTECALFIYDYQKRPEFCEYNQYSSIQSDRELYRETYDHSFVGKRQRDWLNLRKSLGNSGTHLWQTELFMSGSPSSELPRILRRLRRV